MVYLGNRVLPATDLVPYAYVFLEFCFADMMTFSDFPFNYGYKELDVEFPLDFEVIKLLGDKLRTIIADNIVWNLFLCKMLF